MASFRFRQSTRRTLPSIWRCFLLSICLTALHGHDARGEEAEQTLVAARLELTLPADCGTSELFLERVRVRSVRIRFAPEETALVVRAALHRQISGLVQAQLTLVRPNGSDATRTIEAGNCDEALDGLALLTAVTLDPAAATRVDTGPPRKQQAEPLQSAPPRPVSSAPTQLRPATVTPQKPQSDSNVGLSLLALGTRGPAPKWLPGIEGAVEWSLFRDSLLSPAVRLAVSYQTNEDIAGNGGKADFSLTSGALDLCPFSARAPVDMRLCGQITAGRLRSAGHDTVAPETHQRPWFAPGAVAEIALPLSRNWSIPLRGSVLFPQVRDAYQFAPSSFYRTPLVAMALAAGLKTQFW